MGISPNTITRTTKTVNEIMLLNYLTSLLKCLGLEVPWWQSGLRNPHCHCCGLGHCYGMGPVPGPGTSTCHKSSQKKRKKESSFSAQSAVLQLHSNALSQETSLDQPLSYETLQLPGHMLDTFTDAIGGDVELNFGQSKSSGFSSVMD